MKISCSWKDRMAFVGQEGAHQVAMDARSPLGADSAFTPKQLLLASICGCTGMDVVALLKKYKEPLEKLEVTAEAEVKEGVYPPIFKEIELTFRLGGTLKAEKALEAIHLSQTKFCGVSAMVAKAVPIHYRVELNGTPIGEGKADFEAH